MNACEVCGRKLLKTKDPKGVECRTCRKALCPTHAHYYVDESNRAITESAQPTCATCAGIFTVHCFWGHCGHIVENRDTEIASRLMQQHYDDMHEADLVALGYCGAS